MDNDFSDWEVTDTSPKDKCIVDLQQLEKYEDEAMKPTVRFLSFLGDKKYVYKTVDDLVSLIIGFPYIHSQSLLASRRKETIHPNLYNEPEARMELKRKKDLLQNSPNVYLRLFEPIEQLLKKLNSPQPYAALSFDQVCSSVDKGETNFLMDEAELKSASEQLRKVIDDHAYSLLQEKVAAFKRKGGRRSSRHKKSVKKGGRKTKHKKSGKKMYRRRKSMKV